MNERSKAVVLCAALMICLWELPVAEAGGPKPEAGGPIPTQIVSAKKVFIANGGENQLFIPLFSGGPERAYDEFYAGMKARGRYELVGVPADADLLFEIELAAASDPDEAQFRLVIRDPKTNALLWVVNEHVEWAVMQGNHDKNFDLAIDHVINDVEALAARSAAMSNNKP